MAGQALSRRKASAGGEASGLLAYAAFAAFTIGAFLLVQLEIPAPYMVRSREARSCPRRRRC